MQNTTLNTSSMPNVGGEMAGPSHLAHPRQSGRSTYRRSEDVAYKIASTRAEARIPTTNRRPSSQRPPRNTQPMNGRSNVFYRAVTTILTWIADRSRVHHWYWGLGLSAVVLYTIQATTHDPSNIWRHLAYTVVIYGTASIMMVEQLIAKFVMARKIMVAEFLISILVVCLSVIGWTLWSLRKRSPLFEPIGSCCFDLVEVVLMLRFAYRSLVGNFEEYSIHPSTPTPTPYQWWDQQLEAGRLVNMPVPPPEVHMRHSAAACSVCRRISCNKDVPSARSSSSYGAADMPRPKL